MTERVRTRESTTAALTPPRLASADEAARELTTFIAETVDDAGADGAVVNLSGGIDSTVTATLAAEALGSDRVTGFVLPAAANQRANVDDARQVAEELVIDHRVVDVQPLLERFVEAVTGHPAGGAHTAGRAEEATGSAASGDSHRAAVGNAAARLRAMVAYFEANASNRLVLGTGNRTELLLGYYTKYGDGAADLLPIGDLYKTQVRDLARHLDVRDAIVEKPPTAGLWAGQSDETELGAPYEVIDTVLYHALEEEWPADRLAAELAVDERQVRRLLRMHRAAAHKRRTPPTPSVGE